MNFKFHEIFADAMAVVFDVCVFWAFLKLLFYKMFIFYMVYLIQLIANEFWLKTPKPDKIFWNFSDSHGVYYRM